MVLCTEESCCGVARFQSSNDSSAVTSLEGYVERMKEKQEHIYFIAGGSRAEVGLKSWFKEELMQ